MSQVVEDKLRLSGVFERIFPLNRIFEEKLFLVVQGLHYY